MADTRVACLFVAVMVAAVAQLTAAMEKGYSEHDLRASHGGGPSNPSDAGGDAAASLPSPSQLALDDDWACYIEVWAHPYVPAVKWDHTAVAYVRKVPGQNKKRDAEKQKHKKKEKQKKDKEQEQEPLYTVQFYCNHGDCPGEMGMAEPTGKVTAERDKANWLANPMFLAATYVQTDPAKCPEYLLTCDMLRDKNSKHHPGKFFTYARQHHVCNTDTAAQIWSFAEGANDPLAQVNDNELVRDTAYIICTTAVPNYGQIGALLRHLHVAPGMQPEEQQQQKGVWEGKDEKERDKGKEKHKSDKSGKAEKSAKTSKPVKKSFKLGRHLRLSEDKPLPVLSDSGRQRLRQQSGTLSWYEWPAPTVTETEWKGRYGNVKSTVKKLLKRNKGDGTDTEEQQEKEEEAPRALAVRNGQVTDYDEQWWANCILPTVYNCWASDAEPTFTQPSAIVKQQQHEGDAEQDGQQQEGEKEQQGARTTTALGPYPPVTLRWRDSELGVHHEYLALTPSDRGQHATVKKTVNRGRGLFLPTSAAPLLFGRKTMVGNAKRAMAKDTAMLVSATSDIHLQPFAIHRRDFPPPQPLPTRRRERTYHDTLNEVRSDDQQYEEERALSEARKLQVTVSDPEQLSPGTPHAARPRRARSQSATAAVVGRSQLVERERRASARK